MLAFIHGYEDIKSAQAAYKSIYGNFIATTASTENDINEDQRQQTEDEDTDTQENVSVTEIIGLRAGIKRAVKKQTKKSRYFLKSNLIKTNKDKTAAAEVERSLVEEASSGVDGKSLPCISANVRENT